MEMFERGWATDPKERLTKARMCKGLGEREGWHDPRGRGEEMAGSEL
jgi:hypothetical protein